MRSFSSALFVAVLSAPAAGCAFFDGSFAPPCDCGPAETADFDAAQPDVAAVYGGEFRGSVVDAGEGTDTQPCEFAGSRFTLDLDIGEASDCGGEFGDCSDATSASYPVSGSLRIGNADAMDVSGALLAFPEGEDLSVGASLTPPALDADVSQWTVVTGDDSLAEAQLSGILWQRMYAAPDGSKTWEICSLQITGGLPMERVTTTTL